jgi:hypothetical protein
MGNWISKPTSAIKIVKVNLFLFLVKLYTGKKIEKKIEILKFFLNLAGELKKYNVHSLRSIERNRD